MNTEKDLRDEISRLKQITLELNRLQDVKFALLEWWTLRMIASVSLFAAQHVAIHIGPEYTLLDGALVVLLGFLACRMFLDSQRAYRDWQKKVEETK